MKEAIKHDDGKPSFSLIPQYALWEVAKAFTSGKDKYDAYNYSKGMEYSRLIDAALRHINKALRNHDMDEELTENYHLAHAIASLMMCLDNQIIGTIKDDRNKDYK